MRRMMRCLSVGLLLSLVLFLGVSDARAAEVIASGDCGENLSWVLTEDGTLTISGEGDMDDYTSGKPAPWNEKIDVITRVVVEEGITGVGEYAFYEFVNIREVSLPDSLRRIGQKAFLGCSDLKVIVLPDQLEVIQRMVFTSCTALESVTIGEHVTCIYESAFSVCKSLKEIRIPGSVRRIMHSAFQNCTALESVTLENGVQSLDLYAFQGCSSLKEIVFPESMKLISECAFTGCRSLETVKLNDGLVEIGTCAFSGCKSLKSIVVPDSVKQIGVKAFLLCDLLEMVVLSEGLQSIGEAAFSFCPSLKSLVIPASVVSIGKNLIDKSKSMQTIHLLGNAPELTEGFLGDCPANVEICVDQDGTGWDTPKWAAYDLIPCSYTTTGTATCTEGGTGSVTCSHCELDYTYPISAGHRFGKWYTAQEPTETAEGRWERVCEICGEKENWVIPVAEQMPLQSYNKDRQDYKVSTTTVNSYLRSNEDGTLTRIEGCDTGVSVELYDENCELLSRKVLPMELPIFGGFYEGADYFYLVFGQKNLEEDDAQEVIRVVCYSKDWARQGYASLLGYDITIPFDAGSLRMIEAGNTLYVLTSREAYRSSEGRNHQTNLLLRIPVKEISSSGQYVLPYVNSDNQYVSHSFNQFLLVNGDRVFSLNHGDALPRSAAIHEILEDSYVGHRVMGFADSGRFHYNSTGASLGAFLLSDSAYLTAGNSIRQDGTVEMNGQRNIFLGVTTENDAGEKSTTIKWITGHPDDLGWQVSTPHLVKIGGNEFLLLWNEGRDVERILRYVFVDGTGEIISPIYEQGDLYILSDCVPVVCNGSVFWYTTMDSAPVFFEIPLDAPESLKIHSPEVTITLYSENGETEEQTTITGRYGCPIGELPVPVRKSAYIFLGWYTSQDVLFTADTCIGQASALSLYAKWELKEHDHEYEVVSEEPADCDSPHAIFYVCKYCDKEYTKYDGSSQHCWSEGEVIIEPTCTQKGKLCYTCTLCKTTKTESIPATGHDWQDPIITEPTCSQEGEMYYVCSICKTTKTESIPATDHNWQEIVTNPTCTEFGYYKTVCTQCGDSFVTGQRYPLGHKFMDGICIRCGISDEEEAAENPFCDVQETDYFFKPVLWAVEEGITAGTGEGVFSPNATCTRAQVVTFLWRAMGKPVPEKTENPFADVNSGDYFYEAVLWAVENGITSGTGNGSFSPNNPCTRDQVVTFLWRAMGKPVPQKTDNPFTDVAEGAYYYQSVLWAVENGITSGTSATTFAPGSPCTRGQVVTFLFRAMGDK